MQSRAERRPFVVTSSRRLRWDERVSCVMQNCLGPTSVSCPCGRVTLSVWRLGAVIEFSGHQPRGTRACVRVSVCLCSASLALARDPLRKTLFSKLVVSHSARLSRVVLSSRDPNLLVDLREFQEAQRNARSSLDSPDGDRDKNVTQARTPTRTIRHTIRFGPVRLPPPPSVCSPKIGEKYFPPAAASRDVGAA
ncbi:Hypothetical predicted protein [Olea europaea subsp. europaea]|uniref:Uncharacterized protein n=1 Tax=Olea europaea subsp. europaea TaxID=158383 RepID=A0A8S0RAZ9_OLEEU|nr:Hypothetical predicted protein [Olea europaea subsp. europaea]